MVGLSYRITPHDLSAHLYEVVLTIERPAAKQRVWLPVWIPGSYLVREFARHITELHTIKRHPDDHDLPVHKVDKHTWELATTGHERVVQVRTLVYAWDLSVRAAHLDHTHGFFNGPSVFLAVEGRTHEPIEVTLVATKDPRASGWKVATTLPSVDVDAQGFGRYQASDYDHLIDHPVEMGSFQLVEWSAQQTKHHMAVTGKAQFHAQRLQQDLQAVCEAQIQLFHGNEAPPFSRYLFLTTALGDAYGGLEHKDSTALLCKRDDLPKSMTGEPGDGYRAFLGLCSHEYFHLWNVKRIRPASMTPYNLKAENYTSLLWAFEGITSYYDDLMLLRAGVITLESYLELLGKTLTRIAKTPGRLVQPLAEASFDAWIKYYRADENAPNSQMSYYIKGSIVGLLLDLEIRQRTDDKRSLDDVMRLLWQRHGQVNVGVPEDGIEAAAEEVAGSSLRAFFDHALRSTDELNVAAALAKLGVVLHARTADGDSDGGGKPSARKAVDGKVAVSLGANLGAHDFGVTLQSVLRGGAASLAGLSAGDVVVAVDHVHANRAGLQKALQDKKPGDHITVHAFRRDELHTFDVQLQAAPADVVYFVVDDNDVECARRLRHWAGKKHRRDKKNPV
jgi:predicted metalloprotease with PDZ domain